VLPQQAAIEIEADEKHEREDGNPRDAVDEADRRRREQLLRDRRCERAKR
jgi:hypothetical protein